MAISFNLVVCCNNLRALRSFDTFLMNYQTFEYDVWNKPTFAHKWLIKQARVWLDDKALKLFSEVKREALASNLSLGLNDCDTGLFALLHLALKPGVAFPSATTLYMAMSETELYFERLKNPREDVKVGE